MKRVQIKNKFLTVSIPIILLIVVAFYITFQFVQPSPKKEITIATGSENGQYYQTALEYKKLLEKEKVKVNIINTSGSIENIKLLEEKKVDIAFIQNGTIKENNNFEALASIYYEPLWIFYNNKIGDINYVHGLYDRKISIGQKGSGTRDLSLEILKINGIDETNSKLLDYDSKTAKEKLIKGEIDAMFLVTAPSSQMVKELFITNNIKLMSFKRAIAYSKKFSYLHSLTLHEGTVDLYKNMPSNNINLLATTATLVTHKDFSNELIRILLKKVKEVHSQKTLLTNDKQFPHLNSLNITVNEEAHRYFIYGDTWLEKIFPYWIASNVDRLKILLIPLLTLMIPLFKGVFPLYRWSIRSKIYKWYDEVQELDLSLDNLNKEQLKEKLQELENLKKEIKDETKVPLAYMGEYYDLIMHLELIISKTNIRISSN